MPIFSAVLSHILLVAESRGKQVPVWKDDQTTAVFATEPETRERLLKLHVVQVKHVSVDFVQKAPRGRQLWGHTGL